MKPKLKLRTVMRMDSDGILRPKPLPYSKKQLIDYFRSHYKIVKRDYRSPCWKWTGSCKEKNIESYGIIHSGGKDISAHKLSLEIHVGKHPREKPFGLHKCDHKDCVNPDHLYWGTHQDNMRDKAIRGRASRLKGENNPWSKLTDKDIVDMRTIHACGMTNFTELAVIFGLHKGTTRRIVRRESWPHIP